MTAADSTVLWVLFYTLVHKAMLELLRVWEMTGAADDRR